MKTSRNDPRLRNYTFIFKTGYIEGDDLIQLPNKYFFAFHSPKIQFSEYRSIPFVTILHVNKYDWIIWTQFLLKNSRATFTRRWLTAKRPESAKAAQLVSSMSILLPLLTGSRIRLSTIHKIQNYEKENKIKTYE